MLMMTEELQDFDSMRHASIFSSISTIGTLESLHDSFNSSFPTIDSVDTLEGSITTSGCATKTVAWAPKSSQKEHISRYQMTYEEARQTWIFEDEESEMMAQHMELVKRQQEGLPEEEEIYTYRGLDGVHDGRRHEVRNIIDTCVQAVIQEQNKLRGSNREDPLQLAMVSARYSVESTKVAMCRAECDLNAAREVYQQTDKELSKCESNSKLAVNHFLQRYRVSARAA